MTYMPYTLSRDAGDRHVVPRPRPEDAIGNALRNAYDRDFGVSDEFAELLRQIDEAPQSIH